MAEQDQFQYQWWALCGVSILAFTAFLDATMVNTALPFIQTDLKTNILQLQWVANIFRITLGTTMIAMGKLADLVGRARVFYVGVFVFAIAAAGAGLSPTVQVLIGFRGLQALGASTIFVVSAALLIDIFPAQKRVRAISIYGGITGFGLMMGPFLGGLLIEILGWRWIFWINLPLIITGLTVCSFSLQRPPIHKKGDTKVDVRGFLVLIFALGALMYGIVEGAKTNWKELSTWILLTSSIFALALLMILDAKRKHTFFGLIIFKRKTLVLTALSCALAGVASTVFMFFDPLYLHTVRQLSPFWIGLLIAIIPAAQAFISLIFNVIVTRYGVLHLLFFSVIAAFLAISLHRFIGLDTPLQFLVIPFFLLGINWGLSNSAMISAINQGVSIEKIGGAIGIITTIWNVVGALVLASSTAVFHAVPNHNFLTSFHRVIEFNIVFGSIILFAATLIWIKSKNETH